MATSTAALRAASPSSKEPSAADRLLTLDGRRDQAAMLADQATDEKEALLDLGQPLRVEADAAGIAAEFAGRILHLRLGRTKGFHHGQKRRIELRQSRNLARHARNAARDSVIRGVQDFLATRASSHELLRASGSLALGTQGLVLAGLHSGLLEFGQLEAQKILTLGARPRISVETGQLGARFVQRLVRLAHLRERRAVAGKRVHDRELAVGIREQVLVVL
jgi:hypothetical protein